MSFIRSHMKGIAAVCITLAMFLTISPAAEATPVGQATPVNSTQPATDGPTDTVALPAVAAGAVALASAGAFAYGFYRGYQTDPVEQSSDFARMMQDTHQPMNFARFDG